jgi:Na+/pantothenate symporter
MPQLEFRESEQDEVLNRLKAFMASWYVLICFYVLAEPRPRIKFRIDFRSICLR